MARRPAKAPGGKSKFDLDDMKLNELMELEVRVKKAITDAKERERVEVKQKIEEMATSSGFSVNELFSGRSTKGKTVAPKYMNPDNRSETWTGRGRKPRWLTAQLDKGKKLEDFAI
ncbi:MAG: H-NS histone family protein [Pseudomonadota bacterium]